MSYQSSSGRFHSLDALRAFALLLGIVFHAAESFMAGHTDWAIIDHSPSTFLYLFRHASHSFRLEIFFLIAGFFAHLLVQKRGTGKFVWNRTNRILIPFTVGWSILMPLCVYVWLVGKMKTGDLASLGIPEDMMHLPAWQLVIGYVASFGFVDGFLGVEMMHLWFLHQLLAVYIIVLIVRAVMNGMIDRNGSVCSWMDQQFQAVMLSRWNILLFAIPTVVFLWFMQSWTVDTPRHSLIPQIPTTLLYGFFFMIGWFVHRQTALLSEFQKRWKLYLFLALLLVLFTGFFREIGAFLGVAEGYHFWARPLYKVSYALMMWLFVFGVTGFFLRYCNRQSPAWRYVSDSSYWLYLIHIPIVVYIQVVVAYWDVHWLVKFPLINLIAFPILFLSYHYLVRSTFIGVQLNGRKYPFRPLLRKIK